MPHESSGMSAGPGRRARPPELRWRAMQRTLAKSHFHCPGAKDTGGPVHPVAGGRLGFPQPFLPGSDVGKSRRPAPTPAGVRPLLSVPPEATSGGS